MSWKSSRDHSDFEEMLYLDTDGQLSAGERRRLEQHVAACSACRSERQSIARLGSLLDSSRLEVTREFTDRVLAALPEAGWEGRARTGLRAAALVFALLSVLAAVVGLGGREAVGGPLGGAVIALLELFASAVAAGAGLLTASWRGLGLALGDVFRDSAAALAAFGLVVLGVDALLLRYLWRRRAPGRSPAGRTESAGE